MLNSLISMLGGGVSIAAPFLAVYGGASADQFFGVAFDSAGNIILAGSTASTGKIGSGDGIVVKLDKTGTLQWARTYGAATLGTTFYGVAVDGSDNIIVCGSSAEPAYGGQDGVLMKLSGADGTITWQRELGGTTFDVFYAVAIDASGNIAVTGETNANILIAYYNSSGTIQWHRTLDNGNTQNGRAVCFDSSGNVYVCGTTNGGSAARATIAKYNSSGTIQWKSLFANSSDFTYGNGIDVDGSNNPHVLFYTASGAVVAKVNSTASAITWQRSLTTALTGGIGVNCLQLDSSNNVYALVYGSETQDDAVLAVYNSSGTIQFKNRVRDDNLTHDVYPGGLAVSANYVAIAGDTTAVGAGSRDGFLFHVPIDGTGTGTRNTIEYEASGMTDAAGTATIATATSVVDAAGALTSGTSALSTNTLSLTLTVS